MSPLGCARSLSLVQRANWVTVPAASNRVRVEQRITTTVDTTAFVEQKQRALAAHASQVEESWFSRIPSEVFVDAFGTESFIRVRDTTGASVPEDDLLAGIR